MDSAEEGPPLQEVVTALLDYLVDPMLPLKVSGKDPPLLTQEAVAKQMHAVVLLYNYYHREQNTQLEFLEFEAFCKLAVSLKPSLIAHMKYMQRTDLTRSDDMERQLSVTEKAIKEACKISLALTALKDVSNAEGWPVSKVSVLLIDSKKENCLLLFSAITNGVWSVIEKCIDISNLPPEGPSKGKHTNKRKRKGVKVLTNEQSDGELAFQRIAFSAVKEATGINQSGLTILEKHVAYSLSEEKMAAYFYIMQCTQSNIEEIQVPIKDVIKSLQGPLLKRTSNNWILTPKIEYYNVLPYARIMSGWLSREVVSACSQTLNSRSSWRTEKDSEKETAEIEKVKSNCLHNLIVELQNVNTNSSQGPQKHSDGEVQDNRGSINWNCTDGNSCSKEPNGANSSNRKKEEVDEKEKPDKYSPEKPSNGEATGADSSNRKEVADKENPDEYSPENPSDREPTGSDGYNRKDEVDDKEIPDICAPEKPSGRELQDNGVSICGNCIGANACGKELIGAESSNRKVEIDDNEKPDKYSPEKPSDGEPTGVESSNKKAVEVDDKEKTDKCAPEKPSDGEVQDNRGSIYGNCTGASSCGKEPTGAESSKRKAEVDDKEKADKYSPEKPSDEEPTVADSSRRKKDELDDKEEPDKCASEKPTDTEVQDNRGSIYGNCTGANSCIKEPTGAGSFHRKEEVDEKEKLDNFCDITNSNPISFGNADVGASKMTSAEELQISPNFSSKCDWEPTGADSSNRMEEEVDDKEKPDKCDPEKPSDRDLQDNRGSICGNSIDACGKEPIGAESSDRKDEVDEKEKSDNYSPEKPSDGEPTGAESSNRKELEVDDKEKADKCAPEKPSDWEVQDNRGSIYGSCTGVSSCGKVPTGAENSNRKEEVDDKEKADKYSPEKPSDEEPTVADSSDRKKDELDDKEKPDKCAPEKPSDAELQDNRGSIYGNFTGANSCIKEPTGADSFNRKEEFDEKEKLDKCCDITNSNPRSFSNADVGASKTTFAEELEISLKFSSKRQKMDFDGSSLKMTSAEELQISPKFSSKRQKMDVDGIAMPCPTRGGKNKNYSVPIRVYHHQKRKIPVESVAGSSVLVTRCSMETSEAVKSNGNEFVDGKFAGICIQGPISSPLNDIPAADCAVVPYEPNANDVEKLQSVLATKETEISETALRVLLQKREEMCHQQRILEDKIALCSRDIQKIIDGDNDTLALKLEAMIDCCTDTCLKGRTQIEGEMHQDDVQSTGQCSRRNRQPEAMLTFQSPCQELDYICHMNKWRLPRYSVSASTGGFVANVTVEEIDFHFSCEGALLSTPHAARDSAAARTVAKVRGI